MAAEAIMTTVRHYLAVVRAAGIPAEGVVLYGSFAAGREREWSDIDVLVILDDSLSVESFESIATRLWALARQVDTRIEPLAVRGNDWHHDEVTPLYAIARAEGIPIAA